MQFHYRAITVTHKLFSLIHNLIPSLRPESLRLDDAELFLDWSAALACALEQGEGPVVGVEHHLLRLARVDPHERHAAVTKPDMGSLYGHRTPLSRTTSWLQSNW
jgi:hypothetical protein